MSSYFADYAWLPHGWGAAVQLECAAGAFVRVDEDAVHENTKRLGRFVLPGMPNLHSHAFQRAMAGLAERRQSSAFGAERDEQKGSVPGRTSPQQDSFWTWRETMYAFAGRIGPDELRAVAAQLYVEMLQAGYTQVCEFHYLHHQPDGRPYADHAAMSHALIDAAAQAGIGLTLLPTLYMTGGFDGRPLSERQRRFGHALDTYLRLIEDLAQRESPTLRIGVALHSLRAVPPDALRAVFDWLAQPPHATRPVHIHIAEQIGEVQDCLALRGARPVEWLLDHAPLDARWCLVHATHMTPDETRRVAQSGAVAGLCPTTEANLGDGLFPLKDFLDADGTFGIGSDSHISVSPVEELRWLEYGQRLHTRHRNIAVSELTDSVGETLWGNALFGGAAASGAALGALEGDVAARADLIVLDDDAPLLAARTPEHALDTFLFAGNSNLVRDVMVAGDWCVRGGRHRDAQRIAAAYRTAVERLAREV